MSIPDMAPIGQPISLRAHVEKALSAAIISGALAPGTLLTVPTLAAQFDVSATPVREAMLDLEGRGFVESVRNKGFRVTEMSADALRELAEVRLLLEPPAMERLAARFPLDQLPAFEALAERIAAAAAAGDLRGFLEADRQFHLELTRLLGNTLLVDTIAELRSRTRMIGLTAIAASDRLGEAAAEHAGLLGALAAGDGAAAHELMRVHVEHTAGRWAGNPEREAGTATGA